MGIIKEVQAPFRMAANVAHSLRSRPVPTLLYDCRTTPFGTLRIAESVP